MSNSNNKLKAYVRYDGTGRVIAGSLILQRFKPKVGNWQEIDANECCNPTTTTTTTTEAPVTTTTTSTSTSTSTTSTTTTAGPAECPEDYTIGQAALGGTIAYILQSGDPGYDSNLQQGLVATIADISTGAQWGCFGTLITGADGIAIGTGNQNTIDIMAGCATAGIAARLCGDLVQGGYSDWYLPSKDELNKLYLNRVAIGGFSDFNYWSSTESDDNYAWNQNFYYGNQNLFNKNYSMYVRAIRAFACTIPR